MFIQNILPRLSNHQHFDSTPELGLLYDTCGKMPTYFTESCLGTDKKKS